MKRKILAGTCILLALFFLVSCDTPTDIPGTPDVPGDPLPPKPPLPPDGPAPTDPGDITPPTPPPPPPDDEVVFDSVVDSNNQFALDLYSRYKEKEGNVFFSPFSISSALAMTYEGARGQTAYEIREVFHFPGIDVLRSGYEGIFQEINKADKDYKLHSANALWAEQDYVFIQDYFDTVEKYYSGGVTNLDFKTKPEESRVIINDRVEEKTEDLIKDLIPEGVITPLTRLVLTNAIYFKGTWVWQFDEEDTH
ncbi:MAG: serpin family protein, partial [Nanoarchaeota archaeon]|nr:serpin family protein [Nanoarchaeota archaeon]